MATISKMFKMSALSPGDVQDLTGFIDLGLCYRKLNASSLECVYPLSQAALQALFKIYMEKFPEIDNYSDRRQLKENSINGDDFENLIWMLLLRDTTTTLSLTVSDPIPLRWHTGTRNYLSIWWLLGAQWYYWTSRIKAIFINTSPNDQESSSMGLCVTKRLSIQFSSPQQEEKCEYIKII